MKFGWALIAGILLFLSLCFSRCGRDPDVIDTVATPYAAAVAKVEIREKYHREKVLLKTRLFYGARELKRAWLKQRRPDKLYEAFVSEVKRSADFGFDPGDYRIAELEQAVKMLYDNRKRTGAEISNLDLRITASFFLFTTHLIEGRVRYPGAREFLWQRGMPLENDIAILLKTESIADLRRNLADLHPDDPQYTRLKKALRRFRHLMQTDTFPPVPTRMNVSPGESHKAIPLVRMKLDFLNGGKVKDDTSHVYDEALMKAVNEFRETHGLKADGVINRETAQLLNVPLREKADLISLNLERLRWYPHVTGEQDEIVINVPEYMLTVYWNGKEKLKMRVVLGSEYTPTPVFHDTLKYIVFSPTWTVPNSIFEKEFLPRLQEDSFYFNTERFRFFKGGKEIDPALEPWTDEELDARRYTVVENPGDGNSLGKVKFIMPNDFSIYLHDTPADRLFGRQERALSHGCIRLEKPEELAAYLLKTKKAWNKENIREAMESGEPIKVDLDKPYPVFIVYRTVWVDDDDKVHFREDIYGHDRRHLAKLGRDALSAL